MRWRRLELPHERQEIETAIEQLPAKEVAELSTWLVEYHHQVGPPDRRRLANRPTRFAS